MPKGKRTSRPSAQPARQPELPTSPPAAPPTSPTIKVLPTQLQLGDRLVDERSGSQAEWRVAGRPYTSSGGKIVSVRVESVKQPGVTNVQVWGAHERVRVRRGDVGPA